MIKIYFAKNDHEWHKEKLDKMLLPLSEAMRNKILAYKGWQDRQSRILGKWLLLRLIAHFKLDLSLADIKYTEFNKPYFTGFNFSTAHSGEMVICAGDINGDIGIDIEKIQPIVLEDYQEQLTKNEWAFIQNTTESIDAFYQIWTKKEALLKAIGRGVDIEFNLLDVCVDKINYDGKSYSFYPLSIAEGYIAHIATSAPFYNGAISAEAIPLINKE